MEQRPPILDPVIPEREPGELYFPTIAELAEASFHATERWKALSMMNTPTRYDERRRAFVELEVARGDAVRAKMNLDAAINSGRE